MNWRLGEKSKTNLIGVRPDLIRVVTLGLSYSPYDFAVSEGLRTKERQIKLVADGFSKTLFSLHLVQDDGFAWATDLVAVGDLDKDGDIDAQDKKLTWRPEIYRPIADAMKRAAKELGVSVRWGGDFKTWFDGPHFELLR